jgi:hypothetical protein
MRLIGSHSDFDPAPNTRRRMFEVSAEETVKLAEESRLSLIHNVDEQAVTQVDRSAGVSWTRIAFVKRF